MRTREEIIDRIMELRKEFAADRHSPYTDSVVREHITLCWVLGGTTAEHFCQKEPWNIENLSNTYEDFPMGPKPKRTRSSCNARHTGELAVYYCKLPLDHPGNHMHHDYTWPRT